MGSPAPGGGQSALPTGCFPSQRPDTTQRVVDCLRAGSGNLRGATPFPPALASALFSVAESAPILVCRGVRSGDSPQKDRRDAMVCEQLARRGIADPHLLAAMGAVPRHHFVPPELVAHAYDDGPLPIGHGQTISQPYVVAAMIELAGTAPGHRALDIGCGCGYQTAVLAEIVDEVYAVERIPELADAAKQRLEKLDVKGVQLRQGDGWNGWPEAAPFHVVLVACAAERVPPPLVEQLAPGGRLVMPVGGRGVQHLTVVEKRSDGTIDEKIRDAVAFVPMLRGPL
jgi:protein-L-isoaspartate(D-aspartate) O-methyltransferase